MPHPVYQRTAGPRRLISTAVVLVVLVLGPPALSQVTPEPVPSPGPPADLDVVFSGPEDTPLVGSAVEFELRVTNPGPNPADAAYASAWISESFDVLAMTSSDATDGCSESYGAVECSLGALPVGSSTTISIAGARVNAREGWASAWVGSTNDDPNYENNYGDLYIPADTSAPADVGLTKNAPDEPSVDSLFDYVLRVSNKGPSAADDVVVTDLLPEGVEFVSASGSEVTDSCVLSEDPGEPSIPARAASHPSYWSYQQVRCELGSLPPAGSETVRVTVRRTSPWEIYNDAWVSTANYDANYDNDYAWATIAADPSVTSDIAAILDGPDTAPLVGSTFELRFEISNAGPSKANEVWFSSYLPEGLQLASASSSDPGDECGIEDYPKPEPLGAPSEGSASDAYASPAYYGYSGVICSLGELPVGSASTVTLEVTRSSAREAWVSGWAWSSNFEPDHADNYAEASLPPDTSHPADISVLKSAPAEVAVGETFDYTIEVTNNGPDTASDVRLADQTPYGVDLVSVSSDDPGDICEVSGGGYSPEPAPPPPGEEDQSYPVYSSGEIRCVLGDMVPDERATITLTVTRTTEWEIYNSAWVSTDSYDAVYDNDYAWAVVDGELPGGGDVSAGPEADRIEAAAGSETGDLTIRARGGSDTIFVNVTAGGSPRRIRVFAGRGADRVLVSIAPGASFADVLVRGGRGRDVIEIEASFAAESLDVQTHGGAGNDLLRGYSSTATGPASLPPDLQLFGGAGSDLVFGGAGFDLLAGNRGADTIEGGPGDDSILGGRGRDACNGGPGADSLIGCAARAPGPL